MLLKYKQFGDLFIGQYVTKRINKFSLLHYDEIVVPNIIEKTTIAAGFESELAQTQEEVEKLKGKLTHREDEIKKLEDKIEEKIMETFQPQWSKTE